MTDCLHKVKDGRLHSYEPYVAELDLISELFGETVVLAPLVPPDTPFSYPERAYRNADTSIVPIDFARSKRLRHVVSRVPRLVTQLRVALRGADVVHVRAPSNVALVALAVLAFSRKRCLVKYAGSWRGWRGEPVVYRAQRLLLRHAFRRSVVAVYAPPDPGGPHLVPFFATAFSERDVPRQWPDPTNRDPFGILTVAALHPGKNVDLVLRVLATLPAHYRLTVVGDGEERPRLERLARDSALLERVDFKGRLTLAETFAEYRKARFLVLASRTEGYGKVLVEAMLFGVPPIAADVGLNRVLLEGRGLVFPRGDAEALRARFLTLAADEALYRRLSAAGYAFARRHTLEALASHFERVLLEHRLISPAAAAAERAWGAPESSS